MNHETDPYAKFDHDQLILRDHLAADRTVLANERTFLAYIRTALTLIVAGATLVRFFGTEITAIVGWAMIPLGLGTFVYGLVAFRRMRRRILLLNLAMPSAEGILPARPGE
jgi:putative membrane protein